MNEKTSGKNKAEVAFEILELSRRTLLLHLRFMDMALCCLKLAEHPGSIAVDGETIWFDPDYVIGRYRARKTIPPRIYLHMVFHCVLQHIPDDTPAEPKLWDLACDVAAENIIDTMHLDGICQETDERKLKWLENLRAGENGENQRVQALRQMQVKMSVWT